MPESHAADAPLPPEVARVLAVFDRILPGTVVGAYLFGSFAVGGLRPQSDLDILIALTRPVVGATRQALVDELLKISGRHAAVGPSHPLEVTLVVAGEVSPWRYPPLCELLFGEWLRDQFEAGSVAPAAPSSDLAIVLSTLLQHHRLLRGRPAAQVFDPVPAADLRSAIVHCLPSLLDGLRGDERNVMLTLARMWVTLATGAIEPKDVAAAWVLERVPAHLAAPLELARAAYLGERQDGAWSSLDIWSSRADEVNAFVTHAVGAIDLLR